MTMNEFLDPIIKRGYFIPEGHMLALTVASKERKNCCVICFGSQKERIPGKTYPKDELLQDETVEDVFTIMLDTPEQADLLAEKFLEAARQMREMRATPNAGERV